ncbi:hypothetical protein L7F22_051149 [Adiantum nelumboides]|nr:hypothetical protein [Adiantum nelumboides]
MAAAQLPSLSWWVSSLVILLLLHLLVLAHGEISVVKSSSSTLNSALIEQSRGHHPRQRHTGLQPSDCAGACSFRCSKTSTRKACMFFCNKCCLKCLCVPPGTYGNKQVCPCYNDWKTQQGGPKCP